MKDEDFSHKFLMCLPKRFKTLRIIIFRGALKDVSSNEVLRDVMIEDQYNDNDDKAVKEEDKKKKIMTLHPLRTRARAKPRRKIQVMRNAPMMIVMMNF
jgi:hypothetical protein